MSAVLSGLASLGSSEVSHFCQTKQTAQPFTFLHTLSFNSDFMESDMTKIIRSILFAHECLISASAHCMNANKYYGWMQR
jgi:hypothetical protein